MSAVLDARLRSIRRRAQRRDADESGDRDRDIAQLQALGAQGSLRLNVGCGPETLEGWTNVDIVCDWDDDVLFMDATEPWPLRDGCADAVNSEHFIEHIEREEARAYFEQAARVLRPGGVIRTSTPSLRGTIDAYLQADPATVAAHREHGYDARNHADMLNNYFFQWGHRHIYDFDTLAAMLEEAGFGAVEEVEFDRSSHSVLQGVDTHDMGAALQGLVIGIDAVRL